MTVLMAGRLFPNDEGSENNELMLSAMAIFSMVNYMCYMCLIGPQQSTAARVSNRLGAGSALDAGVSAVSGVIISASMGIMIGATIILARVPISFIFSTDENLRAIMQTILWELAMYQLGVGMCTSLEGILIGARRQKRGAVCVVISYFVVGVPVSYICGYTFKLGLVGLIIGRVVGKVVQLVFYAVLVIRTDWDEQVRRARSLINEITAKSILSPPEEHALEEKRMNNPAAPDEELRTSLLINAAGIETTDDNNNDTDEDEYKRLNGSL